MKLVVGNLKMYMNIREVETYVERLKNLNNENVVVCPSFIYLSYFLNCGFKLGVQNIFCEEKGAYTGEISPLHVGEMGVKYVILGHSERRNILGESDEFINEKVIKSLNNNLKVILCIGEAYDCNNKEEFLRTQIINGLRNVTNLDNIIIAYEPIWAIGSGQTPTNDDIKTTSDFIKQLIRKEFNKDIKVLYGGSVNGKNIRNLNEIDNIDGYLIGGASCDANEFLEIISIVLSDTI